MLVYRTWTLPSAKCIATDKRFIVDISAGTGTWLFKLDLTAWTFVNFGCRKEPTTFAQPGKGYRSRSRNTTTWETDYHSWIIMCPNCATLCLAMPKTITSSHSVRSVLLNIQEHGNYGMCVWIYNHTDTLTGSHLYRNTRIIQSKVANKKEMERSTIFRRLHYLLELSRETSARQRRGLIRIMNPGQTECLQLMAKQILEGQILIYDKDYRYFRRYRNVLRTLKSGWVSIERKKRLLAIHRSLIPRLLRRQYLSAAIRNEIRSTEN